MSSAPADTLLMDTMEGTPAHEAIPDFVPKLPLQDFEKKTMKRVFDRLQFVEDRVPIMVPVEEHHVEGIEARQYLETEAPMKDQVAAEMLLKYVGVEPRTRIDAMDDRSGTLREAEQQLDHNTREYETRGRAQGLPEFRIRHGVENRVIVAGPDKLILVLAELFIREAQDDIVK